MAKVTVLKFGGTSVSDGECWQNIKQILDKRLSELENGKLLIVCSAISQVSNLLEKVIVEAVKGNHHPYIEQIKKKHLDLAEVLGLDFQQVIGKKFEELEKIALGLSFVGDLSPRLHAKIMSYGEILLTMMGAEYLKQSGLSVQWMDAREYLKADDRQTGNNESRRYLSAVCEYQSDPNMQQNLLQITENVIITQGFIAGNQQTETVLLGRGGSDVSAAYFAAKLDARRLEIWTDVPGVFTADPRMISSARLIRRLGFDEAQEVVSAGAKVLHPRCIMPAKNAKIPIHIFYTKCPEMEGTVITNDIEEEEPRVKAISTKKEVTLISMDTIGMWQEVGFLARIFNCFAQCGLSVNLVSTSESNVTVTLDDKLNKLDPAMLTKLRKQLEQFCLVNIKTDCAALGLIGRKIRAILHKITPALEVFEDQQVYLLSQASSDLNLTCVIDEDQVERLAKQLHDFLLNDTYRGEIFGPTWNELFVKEEQLDLVVEKSWWKEKRTELLELAKKSKDPLYVYHLPTVKRSIDLLKRLKSIKKLFYAMKANNHPWILALLERSGVGFECVSKEELQYILEIFPQIDPGRILFTPNFSPIEEYQYAFEKGVNVTLDSIYPLEAWPEVFYKQKVLIRVDPGKSRGHHKYVQTAGSESKFGVPTTELQKLRELAEKCQLHINGLHAHSGSGIRHFNNWSEVALFLSSVAEIFPDISILDLGGGLGVPERVGQSALDIDMLDKSLESVKANFPQFELWLEPGRYFVANAGALLCQVTQVKTKGSVCYVGVNTGMNSLIRPALYGAHHEIVNLSRIQQTKNIIANIVGPICETGDILGHSRHLPQTESGDIMLIATVGAYGKVMASNYTMRTSAKEYILE